MMGNRINKRPDPIPAEPRVFGYADESITKEIIVCGVALFPIEKVAEAEGLLANAKESVGLKPSDSLHCRILFHGDARRGTPWENVNPPTIHAMVEKLCENLNLIGHRPIAFVTPPINLNVPAPPGENKEPRQLDSKGIVSMGFQSIQAALTFKFGYGAVKLWIDPDKSKIDWLGENRQQANTTRSGYIDLGADVEPPYVVPIIETEPKPKLLEIADLYTYVTAQAFSQKKGWKNRWFQDLCRAINPERLEWAPAPSPKWEKP